MIDHQYNYCDDHHYHQVLGFRSSPRTFTKLQSSSTIQAPHFLVAEKGDGKHQLFCRPRYMKHDKMCNAAPDKITKN